MKLKLSKLTVIRAMAGGLLLQLVLLLVLLFTVSGCAGSPPVRTVTREVAVPVAVHPLKAADLPKPPMPLGPRPQSLSAAADMLLSKWCEAVGYIVQAVPMLDAGAGEKPGRAPDYPECEGR